MAAPSPMATVMQKVRERFFPKLGEAHTKFKTNPVVLTLDTGLFFLGVGGVLGVFIRPIYYHAYYKVTGELHEEVKHAKTMRGLPKRVDILEEKFVKHAETMCGLPKRVDILEEKVRVLESRPTIQVPVYNSPSQAARNIIRRATTSN